MLDDLLLRLRSLFRRQAVESELDDELRFHFEQEVEKNVQSGMPLEEARRQARLAFGGAEQIKEECREARGVHFIESLMQDFRYGVRSLRKSLGFTAVVTITLALGIGACTAIFSAVNPILFQPLPYPHADRLTMIWYANADGSRDQQAFHTYRELTERSRSFETTAVAKPWLPTLTGNDQPERLEGQKVSAAYFRTLAVSPVLGRDFQPSDDVLNGPRVVILSDRLWRRVLGGNPAILGQQVKFDDNLYTVIGIMPRSFENILQPSAEIWSPLQYDTTHIASVDIREWGHHLKMIGRVRAGVSVDHARNDLNGIAHNPIAEFPRPSWTSLEHGVFVDVLQEDVTSGVKPALVAVLGAVILVLCIACVNVTNLLLARGAQRCGEFAMRTALGAERSRLIQQLITESLLLALIGGALGLLVAEVGVRALIAVSPAALPRVNAISVDATAFAFALGVTVLTGVIVGLVPSLHASRQLQVGMQQTSRRTSGHHQLTRRILVVAEVALALVLLVSAGLLLHSLQRLFAVDPGFEASHVLTMEVQTSGRRYDDDAARHRFFAQALEATRQVPGVKSAAFTSQLPLSDDSDGYGVNFEGDAPGNAYGAFRYAVSPGYFETLGIPLRRGRFLNELDNEAAPRVAVISESLARRRFPNQDPLGRRFHMGGLANSPLFTIVGVVGDVKQASLTTGDFEAVYIRTVQWHWADGTLSFVARTQGDSAALAPAIKAAIWSVDKDQPILRVLTLDHLLSLATAERRFVLILFGVFALVALVLAATGIFGVLAGSVTERTREIGVRAALGATPGNILALVLRQGMSMTGVGVAIGLLGAAVTSRALISLLFGVSRLDPATYIGVISLLVVVSAIACWLPAWRASRVDPSVTLRAE